MDSFINPWPGNIWHNPHHQQLVEDVITLSSDGEESPRVPGPSTPVLPMNLVAGSSTRDSREQPNEVFILPEPIPVPHAEESAQAAEPDQIPSSPIIGADQSSSSGQKQQSQNPPKKLDESEIDDGDMCPICFESWSNAGEHRLCALRCGHVFGYSCIVRWMNTNKSCPTCKDKVQKHDLRFIYAKKLIALDTMELEDVKQRLSDCQAENSKLHMQIVDYSLKENMWLHRQKELEANIELLRQQQHQQLQKAHLGPQQLDFRCFRLPQTQPAQRRYNLYKEKSLEITKDGGCRSLAYNARLNLMVASAKRTDNLYPGFGVSFIDVNTFKLTAFQRLHGQEIRDLAYHPFNNTLATVSVDKTLKILDCNRNNSSVSIYTSDFPLWACCWDVNNPNIAYIGSQQGMVSQLDQRNFGAPVSVFSVSEDYGAVVAMQTLPAAPTQTAPRGGLVVCKLHSCWFFENGVQAAKKHKLIGPGPYFSMCVEHKTRQIFVSARPRSGPNTNPEDQYIKHSLFYMESLNEALVPNVVHTYHGGFTQTKISKPCFFSVEDDMCIAAYHENDRKVYLWSVASGQTVGSIPAHDNVMGIAAIENPSKAIVTLGDKRIDFHKFAF